jgi:predicted DCC family thiol-disulfide oxidoreductase YuxK
MDKFMNSQAVILFDGVCNFCNSVVAFVIRHDHEGYFKFAPLQSEAARRLVSGFKFQVSNFDSIALVENNSVVFKSTAALRIARKLGALWPLLYAFIIVPRPLRDAAYSWIARNRYRWFGKRDACMVPAADVRSRFIS